MDVLDTDILTLLHAAHPRVQQRFDPTRVATTVISRIEVLQGRFAYVLKAADNEQLLRAFAKLVRSEGLLSEITILPIDNAAADRFDQLRQNKKLRKIGRADLLIASIALAHGVTVVTRNVRHFRQVPGLQVENWID